MRVEMSVDIPTCTFVSYEQLATHTKIELEKIFAQFPRCDVKVTSIYLGQDGKLQTYSFDVNLKPKEFDRLGHEVYEKERTR